MKEIGEEVACGQLDILSRSGVPGTLTRVSTGLDTYIHMNISANIHTHTHTHIKGDFFNWASLENVSRLAHT